jgi:fructose-1-phosphate kinase PfkB-like protein
VITCVTASPALDVTYEVDDLVLGATHRPTAVHRHPGGKAVNVARVVAALGSSVRLVALLPPAEHAFFVADLARDGVAVVPVESAHPLRTCVSIASASSGLMTEVYEHPPAVTAAEAAALVEAVGPGPIALSGSVGLPSFVTDLLAGRESAVDTHGAALAEAVAARAGLLKVNRLEASALLGDLPVPELTVSLQSRTDGRVVVTDGVRGAVAADGTSVLHVAPVGVPGSFPQGSGDAFLGGLLSALASGEAWDVALRLAAGCAAANAQVPGAGRLDVVLARRWAAEVEVRAR